MGGVLAFRERERGRRCWSSEAVGCIMCSRHVESVSFSILPSPFSSWSLGSCTPHVHFLFSLELFVPWTHTHIEVWHGIHRNTTSSTPLHYIENPPPWTYFSTQTPQTMFDPSIRIQAQVQVQAAQRTNCRSKTVLCITPLIVNLTSFPRRTSMPLLSPCPTSPIPQCQYQTK